MKVLIACENSEIIKEQFLLLGHDAHSCDFLRGKKDLPNHHRCDVRTLLNNKYKWDMMIAHPPCTRLCNSGVRWIKEYKLQYDLIQAVEFFKLLLNTDIPKICIENPIPHKYALNLIGKNYTQLIQPWQFGEKESKATCLWLKNLPLLTSTHIVPAKERTHGAHLMFWKYRNKEERMINRSKTYLGIAKAMATQWGDPKYQPKQSIMF